MRGGLYARVGALVLIVAFLVNVAYAVARGELYAFLAARVFYVGWFSVVLAAFMYVFAYNAAGGYIVGVRRYFVVGGLASIFSGVLWVWKLSGGQFGYIGPIVGPILFFLLVVAYFLLGAFIIAVAFIRR